ncbi:ABC transporter C family member 3 [Acropora cervicornis]|uniref:ABC transporter C family member 3 n=1 Tax=Acropora cervicornis TaxID=6130 RepID=A0AAD9USP8_ACRCE|nr:ABC transporter C family member 3 [Acropora cervicornis]
MEDLSVKNPQNQAGFLSSLTFSWMTGILKLGYKQPLEEKHLFELDSEYHAEKLVADLEMEWLAEQRSCNTRKTKPRFWRAMMRTFSNKAYLVMIILRILYSLCFSGMPLLIWFFLKTIASTGSRESFVKILPLVLSFALMPMIKSFSSIHLVFKSETAAIKLKTSMIGLAIEDVGVYVMFFSFHFLDIAISLAIIWVLVAWQALLGACFMLVVAVYGSLSARKTAIWRRHASQLIDNRLEVMKEIVAGIRAVKMYAWEWNFKGLVATIRRKELFFYRLRGMIISSIYALFFTSTAIAGFISVLALIFSGIEIKSFQVFTLFSTLGNLKMISTMFIGESLRFIVDAKTAMARVQKLLENFSNTERPQRNKGNMVALQAFCRGRKFNPHSIRTESFRENKPALFSVRRLNASNKFCEPQVVLSKISCFWSNTLDRPSLKDISLKVTNGQLVGITGPVGSGKTSLLMAILGELPISSGRSSCYGTIAYLSQVPWVFSGTLRENILFGRDFDKKKYDTIIQVCDLKTDLDCFPKGDLTEVGQRGVILSGGQRARVSLARGIYSDADIYLLDDPLSALDAAVGKHLFNRCIKGFLANRIRILVSHQLQFLKQTDYVIVLENGTIKQECKYIAREEEQSALSGAMQGQSAGGLLQNCSGTTHGSSEQHITVETMLKDEKVDLNDEEEDRVVGSVKWWRYWRYFRAALPVEWLLGLFVFLVIAQVSWIAPYWWSSRMTEMPYEEQKSHVTLLIYGSIVGVSLLLSLASSFCYYLTALRASEKLHSAMTEAVLKAPALFFDRNPAGRILNRFSKDLGCMDDLLPGQSLFTIQLLLFLVNGNVLSAVSNVWLFLICVPLMLLFIFLANFYLRSSREFRRIEAMTCSPLYSSLAGMALSYIVEMLDVAQYGIRMASETENHMTSVERVMNYTSIEPEPGYAIGTSPPEQWPHQGALSLCDLSLAYLTDAPKVLNNINITIAPKEKVGIAGRTGAGKSSLVAALFRMPEPEGKIIIDGLNINDLNLQASRGAMAVITQDPVLFSGSLRRNLDPFSSHDDHDLWSALEEVQLKTVVKQLPGQLDYKLKEFGRNFSVGERQLVCLARALLQKRKIIILDEATANVDYKTDYLIQEVIRKTFKDSTVLTIAHRLNTIMDYDKVLVIDRGRVVEFDKPENLLQNDKGYYTQLVQTYNVITLD